MTDDVELWLGRLNEGERLNLPGVGWLEVERYEGMTARNLKTGVVSTVPDRWGVRFTPDRDGEVTSELKRALAAEGEVIVPKLGRFRRRGAELSFNASLELHRRLAERYGYAWQEPLDTLDDDDDD